MKFVLYTSTTPQPTCPELKTKKGARKCHAVRHMPARTPDAWIYIHKVAPGSAAASFHIDPPRAADHADDDEEGQDPCTGLVARRDRPGDLVGLRVGRRRPGAGVALGRAAGGVCQRDHGGGHEIRADDAESGHLVREGRWISAMWRERAREKEREGERTMTGVLEREKLTCCPTPVDPSQALWYHCWPHVRPLLPPTHWPAAAMEEDWRSGMMVPAVKGASCAVSAIQRAR